MHTAIKKILGSLVVFSALFTLAWATVDLSEAIIFGGFDVAEALSVSDCHACTNHDGGGGGGGGGFGGFGGGGGGGGDGGGGGSPTPACVLDLTKDKITWSTTNVTNVAIVPLTNSPQVPGASATPNPAPGTVVFSGDFGAFKAQNATVFQSDATARGSAVLGNASFKANKATADRLCSLVFPGTVNGTFHSDTFSSPKNNTIAIWNGFLWSVLPAKGNDPHLRNNFTCVIPSQGGGIFPLSGIKDFIPPLGVGTHTYKLTATGPGGNKTCQATVVVPPSPPPPPPPGPGCIQVLKETFDPSGNSITPVAQFAFKLDGGVTAYSDANGNARFDNVTPGTHTITEVNPGSSWQLLSVTPANGQVVVSSGSTCSAVVFKNKQVVPPPPPPPGAPSCTLSATPSTVDSGDTTTLSWSTTNAVSFSIDHGIGAVFPVGNGATTSPALTAATTFAGTVTNANGDSAFCDAFVDVESTPPPPPPPPPPPDTPMCTLSVSSSNISPGESISISWTSANVTSGSINHNVGTTTPVSSGTINNIFPSDDTLYTGTFTGPNGDISCTASVTVTSSGCQSGCGGGGGGLDQPNVSLAKAPGGTVLGASFVSLSQIPYTGFEAGLLLTLAFWTAVALWSVGITYVFLGRGSIRFLAGRLLSNAPNGTLVRRFADEDLAEQYVDVSHAIREDSRDEGTAAAAASVAAPASPFPHDAPVSALPAIEDVLESRAHAAGVLLSPEAITIAKTLKADRAETLRMFGDILNEAVRTIPREDGWILLSAERIRDLIKAVAKVETLSSHEIITAPSTTAPLLGDSAVNRFASSLLSGNRDSAFSLLLKLEREGASAARFATQVATTLDGLYRSRKTGSAFADMALAEKAALVSVEDLGRLVETFAHALDTAYSSQYTNLKIALAQAFDIWTT